MSASPSYAEQHRRLLVTRASTSKVAKKVMAALRSCPDLSLLWASDTGAPNGVKHTDFSRYAQWLGREVQYLVIDINSGFDPNAITALSGCVRGGGTLLFILPSEPLPCWDDPQAERVCVYPHQRAQLSHYFLQHIAHCLEQSAVEFTAFETLHFETDADDSKIPHIRLNAEQLAVVAQVQSQYSSSPNTCALLTADRGRGKSTAMARLAQHWMNQGYSICLTAPRKASVQTLYQHLDSPDQLPFVAPDALVQAPADEWQIILVDEAAGIHLNLLDQLCRKNGFLLMASTVHGYEGAGRGFATRFLQSLQSAHRQHCTYTLKQPVRWRANDPLEQWINRSFFLNAELPPLPSKPSTSGETRQLAKAQLAEDPSLLQQVYGLLLEAHYQTRPLDLRQLLDGPNLCVFIYRERQEVLAVALVANEGGFPEDLKTDIAEGKRRPAGHLLPQQLAQQAGHPEALNERYWRIVRIAVRQEVRRRGIGQQLLQSIIDACPHPWLGSSFGATQYTLNFWQSQAFDVVYLGAKRNVTSGCYAVTVLHAKTLNTRACLAQWRQSLANLLPLWRNDTHQLPTALYQQLQIGLPARALVATAKDRQTLLDYIDGRRGYEQSLHALHLHWGRQEAVPDWIQGKLFSAHTWAQSAQCIAVSGRRNVENALRLATLETLSEG